ncbi:hypothetical protein ABZ917_10395 [Nonomuraea wenchangensis]
MSSGSDELKVPAKRHDERDDDVRGREPYERGHEEQAEPGDVRVAGTGRDVLDDHPDHAGGFDDPDRREVREDERAHSAERRDPLDKDPLDDGDDEFARSEQTTMPSPPPHAGSTTGAVPAETPAHAAPADVALFDQDPAEVQSRWRDLQAAFVDDPGDAVQRADGLLSEVVESVTASLNSRTSALRERWKDAGTPDTEQLRQALREYRSVLERLLALSSTPNATPNSTPNATPSPTPQMAGTVGAHTSTYGSHNPNTIRDEVR